MPTELLHARLDCCLLEINVSITQHFASLKVRNRLCSVTHAQQRAFRRQHGRPEVMFHF